jgi:hypothetical protein
MSTLDVNTGDGILKVNLDGTGYKPVALLMDGAAHKLFTGIIYLCVFFFFEHVSPGTSGEARSYMPEDFRYLWKNNLKGMKYSHTQSMTFYGVCSLLVLYLKKKKTK